MPVTFDRDIRRIQNAKEGSIGSGDTKNVISHSPAAMAMRDGEQVFAQESNKPLTLYKKNKGALWKIALSKDGNQTVEKNLEVKGKTISRTLNTSGQVGIGTTSPDDALHVKGNIFIEDASPEITFETGTGKYNWQIAAQENTDQAFEIGLGSNDADASNDTFSPKLTIESSGDVGIGTAAPAHKIDVVGTAGLSTGTAWTNTSDVRIKTNVETVTDGLDKINQLRPVSFNYISDYTDIHQEIDVSKKYNSFIANEYAEVFPDAVSVGGNLERITPSSDIGEPDEVEVLIEDLLQFTPHDLHVYLVRAVQELSAKVTTLENN